MAQSEPTTPGSATIKRLFARSGNRCAFPKCTSTIVVGDVTVGEVCHITAVAAGGPRYDKDRSAIERHGYDNLILLCANHHTVIDADPEAYTVDRLKKMKSDHENRATALLDADAEGGARLLLSINQSGGIAAHTINVHTINIQGPPVSSAAPYAEVTDSAGMTFFRPGEILANVGYPGEQEFTFAGEQAMYLRVFAHGNYQPIGLAKLQDIFDRQKPCPFSLTVGGIAVRNKYGAIIFDPASASVIGALTQGFESGELWGLSDRLFAAYPQSGFPNQTGKIITVLPMIWVEKVYVRALTNYVRVLECEMSLPPPFTVELGAFGVEDAYLGIPGGASGTGRIAGPIQRDAFRRTYALGDTAEPAIRAILTSYFTDFYDLAACNRNQVLTDAIVAANDLAPR